jgi:phage-related protein/predicted XRE-type DNA-binding protein
MKPLRWIAGSKDDLSAVPIEVRRAVGYALYAAQQGEKHDDAKVLKGFGDAGVLEVIARHDGDTFRAVYTVRFADAVYVLHALQKKSKRGIATPKKELDLIRQRLKLAEQEHRQWTAAGSSVSKDKTVTEGSGNVFADLGMPDAGAELVKAQLTFQIAKRIKALGLTQTAARLGMSQPDVSRLMKRRPTGFSTDRLLALLTALDMEVDIVLRPSPDHAAKVSIREEA